MLCVRRLSRLSSTMSDRPHPERDEPPIGGEVLSGFVETMRSPYLLNTADLPATLRGDVDVALFQPGQLVSPSFTAGRADDLLRYHRPAG